MIKSPPPLPQPTAAWFDPATGKPTQPAYIYFEGLDRAIRALTSATSSIPFADLPTGSAGQLAFVSNGRKAGETAGHGTGVLAYFDGTNWIATDTGAAVAA